MEKEIQALSQIISKPKRPFHAILGGAKVSSKIAVISSLLDHVDALFIGGAMAFTFFKAQGYSVGHSLYEEAHLKTALDIIQKCQDKGVALYLPEDITIETSTGSTQVYPSSQIPLEGKGMDVGPKTIEKWSSILTKASTIFWNGPVGVFEDPRYAFGTNKLALTLSHLDCIRIIGGGDSVSAINALGLAPKFTHISTGGGASLELIEQGSLPGIEILSDKTTAK